MSDNPQKPVPESTEKPKTVIVKFLDTIEWLGNKLPDPAVLFLVGLGSVWILSALLSNVSFTETLPNRDDPIKIVNLMTLDQLAGFLAGMVETFVGFHPLGVVLVALLGVGVAEKSGFINAVLKSMLNITPRSLLTPMLILVAIVSHSAADAGYVLVIPIGGVMFYAAGRHPLAGIAAAFAGVSGGFSANFIPSGIDPLLSGLTQAGVDSFDPTHAVNPLCNWYFTGISSLLIIGVGWFLTDWIIEPRLKDTPIDGDPEEMPKMEDLSSSDKKGMIAGLVSIGVGAILLLVWALPSESALRDKLGNLDSYRNSQINHGLKFEEQTATVASVEGPAKAAGFQAGDKLLAVSNTELSKSDKPAIEVIDGLKAGTAILVKLERAGEEKSLIFTPAPIPGAPMMHAIVPIIFFFFLVPGLVHGYVSGNFSSHRDVVRGMSETMETMGYYLVLVFFAALFIDAFGKSNIGILIAMKGANFIQSLGLPAAVTIVGIILLSAMVNLLIGSASAKWAMLAPIFVPMLMALGLSPELTQAAYRVGDSTTNIITPMMPYFPLVVVFCQRYVKNTGIGTVAAMMLPFSVVFLITWTLFLLLYWQIGMPLGVDAEYQYIKPQ
ncbi:MAG: AbgT family transporter [Planctomycetota bacterium]|nr:AbgT family transporter [Planctomycetota bacterium]